MEIHINLIACSFVNTFLKCNVLWFIWRQAEGCLPYTCEFKVMQKAAEVDLHGLDVVLFCFNFVLNSSDSQN